MQEHIAEIQGGKVGENVDRISSLMVRQGIRVVWLTGGVDGNVCFEGDDEIVATLEKLPGVARVRPKTEADELADANAEAELTEPED